MATADEQRHARMTTVTVSVRYADGHEREYSITEASLGRLIEALTRPRQYRAVARLTRVLRTTDETATLYLNIDHVAHVTWKDNSGRDRVK